MTYYERPLKKNHTSAVAVVLGMLVILALVGFLMASPAGKTMLEASGAFQDPVNGIQSPYNLNSINCVFGEMNCSLMP